MLRICSSVCSQYAGCGNPAQSLSFYVVGLELTCKQCRSRLQVCNHNHILRSTQAFRIQDTVMLFLSNVINTEYSFSMFMNSGL